MKTNTDQLAHGRWMLVDDNPDLLQLLNDSMHALTDDETQCFNAGEEAVHAIEDEPDKFQFVITDLDMPGMNGMELCRRLKTVSPGLKVILATGNPTMSEEVAVGNGFNRLLCKPYSLAALRETVEAL